MDIHPVTDRSTLEAYHAVHAAAYDHDYVWLPADPIEELVPLLEGKPEAGERSLLYLGRIGEVPVGALSLTLPTLDNLDSCHLDLSVHPEQRRRGVARALLSFGIEQVQRAGRSRIFLEVPAGPDGPPKALSLLTAVGAKPVLDDVRRLLDLATYACTPMPAPDGYRIVQWVDRCPEALVDGLAYLTGRMSIDAPLGEMTYEQEKWDASRYREKEAAAAARGRTRIATAVVHEGTGAVAGQTDLAVNSARPEVAYQWDTIVDPDHRGHRLGMVLKTWNLQLLVDRVPEVQVINTWNAGSNSFMISVNEELGFRPMDRWTEWQLDL